MQIFPVLLFLLGAAAFAGWVWLLVVAFKDSAMWGVLVLLFSPITAIIFAVKNWEEARKPFLTYMGSSAASVVVMIAMVVFISAPMLEAASQMQDGEMSEEVAINAIEGTMDRMDRSGMLDAEEREELGRMREMLTEMQQGQAGPGDSGVRPEAGTDSSAVAALVERATRQQHVGAEPAAAGPSRARGRERDTVAFHEIDDHMGEMLRVVNRDGTEFIGRYMGRNGSQMEFQKFLSAGTLAVYYTRAEVASLHRVDRR